MKPLSAAFKKLFVTASILTLSVSFGLQKSSGYDSRFNLAGNPVEQPQQWHDSNSTNQASTSNGESLEIVGKDVRTNWLSSPLEFQANRLYSLEFDACLKESNAGQTFCCGTNFFNFDLIDLAQSPKPDQHRTVIFYTPAGKDNLVNAPVRFAQWETQRVYEVNRPDVRPVQPIFREIKDKSSNRVLRLGDGESLDKNGIYRFSSFKSKQYTNFDRPLLSYTSNFNTDRWMLGVNTSIDYCFCLQPEQLTDQKDGAVSITPCVPIPFQDGSIQIHVGYWLSGQVRVLASLDAQTWQELGTINSVAAPTFSLNSLFDGNKADKVYLRLLGEPQPDQTDCIMQIYGVRAELVTQQDRPDAFFGVGETFFAKVMPQGDDNKLDALPIMSNELEIVSATDNDKSLIVNSWNDVLIEGAGWDEPSARIQQYRLPFANSYELVRRVFRFYIQDFTRQIANVSNENNDVTLSWCEGDYHVPQNPVQVQIQAPEPIRIYAAQNDFETFQIVLNPVEGHAPLQKIKATVSSDLISKSGAKIPAENVELRRAYYHYVSEPTDETCAIGYYPDALVPLDDNFTIEPNNNGVLWVTVKTPSNATPGLYNGQIQISANNGGYNASVPFETYVWNFALPQKNTYDTAYGISPNSIWNYHQCKTEEEKRLVYEKYLQLMSDYRMSPYTPTPLDRIKVTWRPDANPPTCELDTANFEREIKRVFEKYNFTNFVLEFHGLGGGSFANRYEGTVAGYGASTPEYDAMMTSYGAQLQELIDKLGLLNAAYVYCFDEPEEKDYEFVAGEFAKLKKYAPKIERMLTEEPSQKFLDVLNNHNASITIWCPILNCFDNQLAQERIADGEKIWDYVCTGPKAPYCTEFIDHLAQELRIWHWQNFERNVTGSLIWETTYWNSPTAFVNDFQNPYEDPMSYQTGYGLPQGTRRNWGNGDGRFIYPPLTAATPQTTGGKCVTDAPNPSIRMAMIRAGVQDYEMLRLFQNKLEERKASLPKEKYEKYLSLLDFSVFTTSLTQFSHDPQDLLKRRQAIGSALEELMKE
ncbi:MAG: DUF4091 domain-containing protein [Planctomycetia bacterium]|nr:DUF4091 domain-containing protein [Planctomycetia bacterium]